MNIQELALEIPPQGEQVLAGIEFITSGKQYLTFELAQEQYAVDILAVEEIRSWELPTIIPNSPSYINGVINMRGIIVPIVDLRLKFNIGSASYHKTTVVIVLSGVSNTGSRTIGFVVDAVSDVLNVEPTEIKDSPAFGGNVHPSYIEGLINVGNDVVTLLNVNQLQQLEKHSEPTKLW